MTKEIKILSVGRNSGMGLGEQAVMALLVVGTVIQIACAFDASSSMVGSDAQHSAAMVQMHDGTMLARK